MPLPVEEAIELINEHPFPVKDKGFTTRNTKVSRDIKQFMDGQSGVAQQCKGQAMILLE
jgi:hypothetical protein